MRQASQTDESNVDFGLVGMRTPKISLEISNFDNGERKICTFYADSQ
jgi:hypothetical protein